MSIDKTVIKIPKVILTQYYPNVVNNVNELVYNEGIYLKKSSLSATYPKSVVRVFKNPLFPKKVYLVSKDTLPIQQAAYWIGRTSTYDGINQVWTSNVGSFSGNSNDLKASYGAYVPYLKLEEENIKNYSTLKQPENLTNLNFEDGSLTGKKINFYRLSPELRVSDTTYANNTPIELNLIEDYNLTLKNRSSKTDYMFDGTNNRENEVFLLNQLLFSNIGSFDNVSNLVETMLESNSLSMTKNVVKTKAISYSDFVENTYENLWVQINEYSQQDSNGYKNIPNTYILTNNDNRYPIGNDTGDIENVEFSDGSNISTLLNKIVFIKKPNDYIPYINERQFFKVSEIERFAKLFNDPLTDNSAFGALRQNNYEIFDTEQILSFSNAREIFNEQAIFGKYIYSSYEDATTEDYTYYRDQQRATLNNESFSTLSVLNEDINTESFRNVIPDDINSTTIYELELDEELDVKNGAFLVVEIE